jgi:diguanylate cyclase (GGDEF)-like protein
MLALLFVDLDDFKRINDSYGHAAGDQILVLIAERLTGAVRAEDIVGRQSGDEFAILLGRVAGNEEAAAAAERVLRELRRPIQLGARSIVVGGSIGVAIAAEPGATMEDLVRKADAAMYTAKAEGQAPTRSTSRGCPSRRGRSSRPPADSADALGCQETPVTHDPDPRSVQRTYLLLTLLTTLASSFHLGHQHAVPARCRLNNAEAFGTNAFFALGQVVFEVPTGVVADTRGRRFSFLLGAATLLLSTLLYLVMWQIHAPFVGWALASILLGLGFTFFSGATEAWLVDALHATGASLAASDRSSAGPRASAGWRCSEARSPAASSPRPRISVSPSSSEPGCSA